MRFTTVAGDTLDARRILLGEGDVSLLPAVGYPTATLKDGNDILLTASVAILGGDEYQAMLSIPVYDGVDGKDLTLVWVIQDEDGSTYRFEDTVWVEERNPQEEQKEPVVLVGEVSTAIEIPHLVSDTDAITIEIYKGNDLATAAIPIALSGRFKKYQSTVLTIPLPSTLAASVNVPYTLVIKYPVGNVPQMFSSRLWVINPSIMSNAQNLLAWINKAQLQNVIPSLRYEMPDLLNAMMNGLSHFNMLGSNLTSFNGLNMTGMLSEAWIICSAWYLLTAQYQAEGNLAFDMQAQATTLSVDRTQYINDLIGRLESMMGDQMLRLKASLGKAGVNSGAGNVANLNLRARVGHVGLTRNPLTQYKGA